MISNHIIRKKKRMSKLPILGLCCCTLGMSAIISDTNNPQPIATNVIDDKDFDGLIEIEELMAGTDPLLADSDGDGLDDGFELLYLLSDPLNPNSPLTQSSRTNTSIATDNSNIATTATSVIAAPAITPTQIWKDLGSFAYDNELTRTLTNVYSDADLVQWQHLATDATGSTTGGWTAYSKDSHTVEFWKVTQKDGSIINCCELDAYAGGGHYGIKHIYNPEIGATSGYALISWQHRKRLNISDDSCAYKFALLAEDGKTIIAECKVDMNSNNTTNDSWMTQTVLLPSTLVAPYFGKQLYVALIPETHSDGAGIIIKDVKVSTIEQVFSNAELIVRYKDPLTQERNKLLDVIINDANPIAWINPHDGLNNAPQMPQLALRIEGITGREITPYTAGDSLQPSGVALLNIDWSISAYYARPTNKEKRLKLTTGVFKKFPDKERLQQQDQINIAYFSEQNSAVTSTNWLDNLFCIYQDPNWQQQIKQGFFGGNISLKYSLQIRRYSEFTEAVSATNTVNFKIGGKNPDDAICRAFIDQIAQEYQDQLQGENIEKLKRQLKPFLYAIAKHESKGYNGTNSLYNQFREKSATIDEKIHEIGHPLWCSDKQKSAGGFGLFQVTGWTGLGGQYYNVDRQVLWNWQDNIRAALAIIKTKVDIAYTFMNSTQPHESIKNMPAGQRPQSSKGTGVNVPVPDHIILNLRFSDNIDSKLLIESAIMLKAYNGAKSHYCSWNNSNKKWNFNPDPKLNTNHYVKKVMLEIEAPLNN